MAKEFSQSFKVFPLDVTNTTQLEQIDMVRTGARWTHSTFLPGGFGRLEITFPSLTWAKYWEWRLSRLFTRFLIDDSSQHVVWEGRLEVPRTPRNDWRDVEAKLLFRGYWSNLIDGVDTATQSGVTGDAAVKALINNLDAQTVQIDNDFAAVDAWSGGTITLTRQDVDLSPWDTLTANDGILAFEDDSGQRYDFMIYDDRKVIYKARNPSSIDLLSYISDGSVENFPDEVSVRDIHNEVNARDSGGLGSAVSDADSIAKYIKRSVVLQAPDTTSKVTLISKTLAERKEPRQRMKTMKLARVFDSGNVEIPLCHVRSGQTLRIPDALTLTDDVDQVTLNAITTFYITGTECRHSGDTVELTITVDNSRRTLANLLKKNGVTP